MAKDDLDISYLDTYNNVIIVDPIKKMQLKDTAYLERILFSLGNIFSGASSPLISAVFFIYIISMGISAFWAVMIIVFGTIIDFFISPILAILGGNMRTKMGRRRPFLVFSGTFIIIALVFLFMPTNKIDAMAAKIVISFFGFVLYNTASSTLNINNECLSTEMANNYIETSNLNLIKGLVAVLSCVITITLGSFLVDKLLLGKITPSIFYLIIIFGFGLVFSVPVIISAFFVKERVFLPLYKEKITFKTIFSPLMFRGFSYFIFMCLFAFVCIDIFIVNALYFTKYIIKLDGATGVNVLFSTFIWVIISMPIFILFSKNVSKSVLFRIALPLYIIASVVFSVYEFADETILYFVCALMGIGLSGCILMPYLIFADLMQIFNLKDGFFQTGTFSVLMNITKKLALAIALFITGMILHFSNFNFPTLALNNYEKALQNEEAVELMRLTLLFVTLSSGLLAFLCSSQLKFNMISVKMIDVLLDKRLKNATYTTSEMVNYNILYKDLIKIEIKYRRKYKV